MRVSLTPYERTVLKLILEWPVQWKTIDENELTATQLQAIQRLVRGGFLEARYPIRIVDEWSGNTVRTLWRVRGRFDEQVSVGIDRIRASKGWKDRPVTIYTDHYIAARLTSEGEQAREDFNGESNQNWSGVPAGKFPKEMFDWVAGGPDGSGGLTPAGTVFYEGECPLDGVQPVQSGAPEQHSPIQPVPSPNQSEETAKAAEVMPVSPDNQQIPKSPGGGKNISGGQASEDRNGTSSSKSAIWKEKGVLNPDGIAHACKCIDEMLEIWLNPDTQNTVRGKTTEDILGPYEVPIPLQIARILRMKGKDAAADEFERLVFNPLIKARSWHRRTLWLGDKESGGQPLWMDDQDNYEDFLRLVDEFTVAQSHVALMLQSESIAHADKKQLPTDFQNAPAAPKSMTWQKVVKLAEAHCARNPYPGVNALATIIGCSAATMSKAIKRSPKLKARKAEFEADKGTGGQVAMSDLVMDSTAQSREANLSDALGDEGEDLFHRLLQQASQEARGKLHSMNPEQRKKTIELFRRDPGMLKDFLRGKS